MDLAVNRIEEHVVDLKEQLDSIERKLDKMIKSCVQIAASTLA
jgi:hypothetical protein